MDTRFEEKLNGVNYLLDDIKEMIDKMHKDHQDFLKWVLTYSEHLPEHVKMKIINRIQGVENE